MEKEYELASQVFNEVIKRYPNSPVISSAKLGYAKTMEEALNKKLSENNNSWKPFFKREEISGEQLEKVVSAYDELSGLYPHSEVAGESILRIGNLYLRLENDLSSAEKYFNRLINEYRNSRFIFDAYAGLSEINLLRDDLNSAEQNLLNVINGQALEDQKNLARYELAQIKFYQGDFSSAKDYLNNVLNNLKDNIANDAIDLSLLLNTNVNDSSKLLIYAKAEKLLHQEKFEEASALFHEIASNEQGFVLQNKAEIKEAEIELVVGNVEQAVSLLLEISSENEKNIYADRALYLLGRIYQHGLKDDIKASEMYESLLAKFPNSLYLDEAREEIIKIRDKVKQGT
jgi:outer membrane protein assembly factor BamD (BamD/ComL family)